MKRLDSTMHAASACPRKHGHAQRALLLALALGSAALCRHAAAQDSGGSFGGGDWGDSGGGGDWGGGSDWGGGGSDWGSGGTDYGTDYGSDYGSGYDYGTSGDYGGGSSYGGPIYTGTGGRGSTHDDAAMAGVCLAVMLVGFFGLIGIVTASRRAFRSSPSAPLMFAPPQPTRAWTGVDVTCVRIALDYRSRPFVQAELQKLARTGGSNDKREIARLLTTTARILRGVESAWLYASVSNYNPMSAPQAQGIFQKLGQDARSGFQHEVIRGVGGRVVSHDAPEKRAREDEGEGLVLVSLVAAARKEILDVHGVDPSSIRRLLDGLSTLSAQEVVALEVIWTPAEENDRMSSAELEARYPSLTKLPSRPAAGRVFCTYCRGPFAVELPKCPHCGAPKPEPRR